MRRRYNGQKGSVQGWSTHIPVGELAQSQKPRSIPLQRRAWRRKYPCKPNKGPHAPIVPGWVGGSWSKVFGGDWITTHLFSDKPLAEKDQYRYAHCGKCGKQGREYKDGRIRF